MFVYCVEPIDHWDGWRLISDAPEVCDEYGLTLPRSEIESFFKKAKNVARKLGWEGDISAGPFWSALPNRQGNYWPVFMMAWKQSNNGSTFIASPFELGWIGDDEFTLCAVG